MNHATTSSRDDDFVDEGFARIAAQSGSEPLRAQTMDLGSCFYPNLDKAWDVLEDAESQWTGR